MNVWHDLDKKFVTAQKFKVLIEISKGSKVKYELDKNTGLLKLDRILHTSMQYPMNYGLIPKTFAEDGDPLDALVLCSEQIQPMTLVDCLPIGVLFMIDSGEKDEKIICVAQGDPVYKKFDDISQLPEHLVAETKHFFEVYKQLENKETVIKDIKGKEHAQKVITDCIKLYKEQDFD